MTLWSQWTTEQKRSHVFSTLELEVWNAHPRGALALLRLFAAGMPVSFLEAEARLLDLPVSTIEAWEQAEFLRKVEALQIRFQCQYPYWNLSYSQLPRICVVMACEEVDEGGSVPRRYEDQLADLQKMILDPSGTPIRHPRREDIEWYILNREFEKLCPRQVGKKLYEL